MKVFFHRKEMTTLVGIIIFSLLVASRNPTFLSIKNLVDILKGSTVLGIISLGMLVVIIAGGIDISVGATIYTVCVAVGYLMEVSGGNILIVFLGACLIGSFIGSINGFLISRLNVSPLIVTLAMMSTLRGTVRNFIDKRWLTRLPEHFIQFGDVGMINGFPAQIFIFLLAALSTAVILKYTRTGRGLYAIGENQVAAKRVGYDIKRIKMFMYIFCGLMAGISGFVYMSIMKQVDFNGFINYEFEVIAAVILGGANIMGGAGSVLGTLLGVWFLNIINNGLVIARIPVFWQDIIVGCIIVLMVSYDVIKNKSNKQRLVEKVL
jgi:simple sugar transport system permease protein/ribose transport system permease protein